MTGSSEQKAVQRATARVEKRLRELTEKHGGNFFWRNGVIRQGQLRPTKGWSTRRWERFEVECGEGMQLCGEVWL